MARLKKERAFSLDPSGEMVCRIPRPISVEQRSRSKAEGLFCASVSRISLASLRLSRASGYSPGKCSEAGADEY